MENFLTQYIYDSVHPALTNTHTHTLEKFSQMENFLTQYNSMHPARTNARTLEKSSQMENFLTQLDSMHPALTNARKILTNAKISSPSIIPCLQLLITNAHTH